MNQQGSSSSFLPQGARGAAGIKGQRGARGADVCSNTKLADLT